MFPELYNYYLWLISGIYFNNQFRYIDKLSNNLDSYN